MPVDRARVADREGAGDRLAPLQRAHALERRRALDPAQRERIDWRCPGARDSSRATSADWLNPRRHSRVRCSGTGTSSRRRPSARSAAPCSAPWSCATATLRPYFRRSARLARQIVISDRGPRPRDSRRLRQAAPRSRRLRSPRAAGRSVSHPPIAEELDLLPAVGAEAVDFADDRRRSRRSAAASAKSSSQRPQVRIALRNARSIAALSRGRARRTSAGVTADLFDMRAARAAPRPRRAHGPRAVPSTSAPSTTASSGSALIARSVRSRPADRLSRSRLAGAAWRIRRAGRGRRSGPLFAERGGRRRDRRRSAGPRRTARYDLVRRDRHARHRQRSAARAARDPRVARARTRC